VTVPDMRLSEPAGVHGASLLALPSGDLLCAWFAGAEGTAGVLVAVSTLRRDQWTWAEPRVAAAAVRSLPCGCRKRRVVAILSERSSLSPGKGLQHKRSSSHARYMPCD
jgi:hypothetical protein